jgi:hypothetical protein
MVAGIVLVALGMQKTLGHPEDPLKLVPAVALLGGTAMYPSPTWPSGCATWARSTATASGSVLLVALTPLGVEIPALATLGVLAGIPRGAHRFETPRFAEARDRVRHAFRARAGAGLRRQGRRMRGCRGCPPV